MGSKNSCHSHPSDKKWMDENVWQSPRLNKSDTVRAHHQLEFSKKLSYCDYCRIVGNKKVKTRYRCAACNLSFCFRKEWNDFKIWHSEECDHYRGYS